MASAKDDGVDERTVDIKEEDCERLTPEDVCVKLENHKERISVFKEEEECKVVTAAVKAEDLNDFSVGLQLQKHESEDIFNQDACEESPSSLQPWSTNTGQLATQENSAEVKSELSESEEKITEGNGREGEESPGSVGINLQKNFSFSSPSFRQPSQLRKEKGMKKSARGSENWTAAFLQCSSLPATGVTQTEAIKTDQQQVEKEIQIHTGNKCLECGKQFTHKGNLNKHMKIHTGEETYSCHECGKSFSRRSHFQSHRRTHTGEKPYCCPECGKLFSTNSHLQRHRKIHTGEKPHCCPECGKLFSSRSHLQDHGKIHTGEKPYCCPYCGKKYSDKRSFQRHTHINTGENPYCCTRCGKRFFNINCFRVHTQTHPELRMQCVCSTCGKCYTRKDSLHRHVKIHTGEKSFCCSECGKQFLDLTTLQCHIRTHTGEEPYCCPECDKQFSQQSTLQSHIRCHTGEKPHSCLECGKKFSCLSSLYSHRRCHTGEKP
uniref:C2H2-type domain-containing protein n=1 Tax=Erpetoichthys calabaricus TaxID=27687 RepID=A0A8C4RNJ7_ERPCA